MNSWDLFFKNNRSNILFPLVLVSAFSEPSQQNKHFSKLRIHGPLDGFQKISEVDERYVIFKLFSNRLKIISVEKINFCQMLFLSACFIVHKSRGMGYSCTLSGTNSHHH